MRGPIRCAGLALLLVAAAATGAGRPAATPYVYVHRAVSTEIAAAQSAFDRGLTLVYAYQPHEAEQAFRQAARLDPELAMAFWGVALALGANINVPPDAKQTATAAGALRHARALAARHAAPWERDYIDALAARYTAAPDPDFDALALAYRDRMRALVARYPDDPDAAALYAEALMDLRPWRLWTPAGEPESGTAELVSVIETGLRAHPQHLGLLHYYIHAVEASREPGRALPGARRLAGLAMEPAAAHLVHMPAHTFLRVGDWQAAIDANEHAVHHALGYRQSQDPDQQVACGHCLGFLTYAYSMQGNLAGARRAAERLQAADGEPSGLVAVLARFGRWPELLAVPEPGADARPDSTDPHVVRVLWRYGRGLAELGEGHPDAAAAELQALRAEAALAPPAPQFATDRPDLAHVYDRIEVAVGSTVVTLAERVLAARVAAATGHATDALALLREAVVVQDNAQYSEPPAWYYPVRETLAAMLYQAGAVADAERVLRECLQLTPHDPRALLGLHQLLAAAGRGAEAARLEPELAAARRHADVPLRWDPL